MVCDSGFHCWSDAQGLVNPAEIVVHEVERNSPSQIVRLLRKCVCQARESSHLHSHREVLSLDIACGNVAWIRLSDDRYYTGADAFSRTNTGGVVPFSRPYLLSRQRELQFAPY